MKPQIALIMGSYSDYPKLERAIEIFRDFGVGFEARVMSAHRTPEAVAEYVRGAAGRGIKVFVGAAGGAAHLPGVIASFTVLPVIGVPIQLPAMAGLDSLLSISQMPAGIPVAAMSAGSGGAENGALMAISILAVSDTALRVRLEAFRSRMADKVMERDAALQSMMAKENETLRSI